MIVLKNDANTKIKNLCHEDSVIAYWHDVCDKYANGYIQVFVTNLQILITKVGIVISKVANYKTNISYCSQSIYYLCKVVLNRPDLERAFDSLGLNDKGNKGKHDIVTNKINMDQAVNVFNRLINEIASTYNLPALRDLIIIKKNHNNTKNGVDPALYRKTYEKIWTPVNTPVVNKPAQTPNKKPKPNIQEKATVHDEKITMTATLVRGDGYFEKGLFVKKKKLNFILKVFINNYNNLKIKELYVGFVCGKNKVIKDIKVYSPRENNNIEAPITLDADLFSGNISATVVLEYKIGLLKIKRIKTKVAKNF